MTLISPSLLWKGRLGFREQGLYGGCKSKLETRLDKPFTKGYAAGFAGLLGFINGLIPANEIIEQALRREVKMFPEITVRELVANALIH